MNWHELDLITRERMLEEFEREEHDLPYRSKILSTEGLKQFPGLMRDAIERGNEDSLGTALDKSEYWLAVDAGGRAINVAQRSAQLALTEFNTWYVAGLAHKLQSEGKMHCQVYRAALPQWEPSSCSTHEGRIYLLSEIIAGHRASYWPPPGIPGRLSIPSAPGCHHTIERTADSIG